ncbi:biotin transporter BioY [Mycoplana dimorpha]|uniref:Biotin transporter BioY n=1 Tax=Mycoplana dimorpha TaxID=28320 RepID=A0A2T5BF10_MYCDI|nr:biotin transporter BioY [Mycoplana dimorpha]PTM97577.1 hypothetical protein C7449_102452 [Mycoplana dimorpha]
MSGLEQAIRNALARAESDNPETRARIYQSARNALEAGLRKQEVNDPEAIAAQRHRLEMLIRRIEGEQRTALQASTAPAGQGDELPQVSPDAQARQVRGEQRTGQEPANGVEAGSLLGEIRPERADGFVANGKASNNEARPRRGENDATVEASPRIAKPPRRRGRLFSFLLVVATLVAAIGTIGWWVQSSGLLLPPAARDGSVANPPAKVNAEDFSGTDPVKEALDTQNSFSAEWHEVFRPDRTDALTAGANGRFETVSTDEGPAVRLVSQGTGRDGAIAVAVEPEVLRAMAGKTSMIAITVEPDDGKPVQVAVECDFAALGNCDRHRFAVSHRTDLLFHLTFDRTLAPNETGRLFITSDVSGGGAGVNLFAVRVLPGE